MLDTYIIILAIIGAVRLAELVTKAIYAIKR